LITATEAKKLYCLTETDLLELPCHVDDNPHNSLSLMRLFRRGDLKQAALAKYGSEEGLAEKKRRNAEIAAKRRATLEANKVKKAAAAQAEALVAKEECAQNEERARQA